MSPSRRPNGSGYISVVGPGCQSYPPLPDFNSHAPHAINGLPAADRDDVVRPSSATAPSLPPGSVSFYVRVGKTAVCWMFIILCTTFLTFACSCIAWGFIAAVASLLPDFPTSDDALFEAALVGAVTLGAVLGLGLCVYWTLTRCTRGGFDWPEDPAVFTHAFELHYIWAGGGWFVPIAGAFALPVGMLLLREPGMDGSAIATVAMLAEVLAVVPELLLLGCVGVGVWRAYQRRSSVESLEAA